MIHGDIKDLNLIDVLQLINIRKQTGKLAVKSSSKRGDIYFKEGLPIHAVSDDKNSDEAIYTIMGWTEGEYEFIALEELPERTIKDNLHNIIMEFTRQTDEEEKMNEILPTMDILLKFNPEVMASNEGISLQPKEWKILSLVNGKKTAREIADSCSIPEEKARKIIYGLIRTGLLKPIEDVNGQFSGEGGGLKDVISKVGKALGVSGEKKEKTKTVTAKVEDSGIAAMADFINELLDEYAKSTTSAAKSNYATTLTRGAEKSTSTYNTGGIDDISYDASANFSFIKKKGESEEEESSRSDKFSKYLHEAADLIPKIKTHLKKLQHKSPLINLIRLTEDRIDVSKAEAKTSVGSKERDELRLALSTIIDLIYEESLQQLGEETTNYWYNKKFKEIFHGERGVESLGIQQLIMTKLR